MSSFYKITSIKERKTKKEDIVYSILLDDNIWINNINPDLIWQSSGKKNMGIIKEINKFWIKNNHSLDSLKGKYISAGFSKSDFGLKFDYVSSLDIIKDFKDELDNSNGEVFITSLPIYQFLEKANYQKNNDSSINIKSKFNNMRIKYIDPDCPYTKRILCYPHYNTNDVLTLTNIEAIFNKFYADLKYDAPNVDRDGSWKYSISSLKTEIQKDIRHCRVSYKMTTSGDYDYWESETVLKIGNKLTDEQKKFLQKIHL